MNTPDDRFKKQRKTPLRPWEKLGPGEQLRMREEYGHHLDLLPPTCSMKEKEARFAAWLAERGVEFP